MSITKTIEEIYDSLKRRGSKGNRVVQWVGNDLYVEFPYDSKPGKEKFNKFKNFILGVYSQKIKLEDLKEDAKTVIDINRSKTA